MTFNDLFSEAKNYFFPPLVKNRRCWSRVAIRHDNPVIELSTPGAGVIAKVLQLDVANVESPRECMSIVLFDFPKPGDMTEARNQDEAQ